MKNKRLLRAMGLADEKFIAEADPEKQQDGVKLGERKNKKKITDPKKRIKRWSVIAASLLVAVTALNLFLFIPYGVPSVAKYSDSEYYSVIKKLNELTYSQPKYKNNFELFFSSGRGFLTNGIMYEKGEALPPTAAAPDAEAPEMENTSGNYEEVTDNQVAGVTEADIIKRSDKHIYYLCQKKLYVYSIAKEDTELVGSYDLEKYANNYYYDWDFYLSKDCKTVTVVTSCYEKITGGSYVSLISLDVSDPGNITEKGTVSVAGGRISTRVNDGKLLLMTNFRVALTDGKPDFDDEYSFIPSIDKGNGLELLPIDDIIAPETLTSARYTVICKLDEATLELEDATALLSYSQEVYVSKDKIFATNGYTQRVKMSNGGVVNKSMTDIAVVSYNETEMKHLGTATVEGYIENQYSLDEYNGILRAVTTTNANIERSSSTVNGMEIMSAEIVGTSANLYCISLESYEIISSVVGFAPKGETVRSVRFDGTDAYVCTAIQLTDPVFFFDLSDVNNITYKETGTIEGFSTSLVNFGNGYLLGIGVGDNWNSFKIEIYEEGKEGVNSVCSCELENTEYSTDYKSYYIDREKQLLGLGVSMFSLDSDQGRYILLQFDGYRIYEILNVHLEGENSFKRGVLVDGYMYMLCEDVCKVEKIG